MTQHNRAAEIRKGDQPALILSESDVEQFLDRRKLLSDLKDGFRAVARGELQMPPRPEISVPGKGFMLSMPAWLPGGPMMVKMVNVFESNLDLNLPNHLATIVLFDEANGNTVCIMDGTFITGIRTAASAVVSVDILARKDACTATIVGAGVQGLDHLALLPLVRNFEKIYVTSLVHEDAVRMAATCPIAEAVDDPRNAIACSDVVCLASHSYSPVIDAQWIKLGTHVSSVGYAPPAGELPIELIERGRLFVEDPCAFEPTPVGCGELAGVDAKTGNILGVELMRADYLRDNDHEITVYKAMGIAMEDLVAARIAFEHALEIGHQKVAVL